MLRVELPPDPATGERRRRVGTFDSRKEAERARTAWLAEIDGGSTTLPAKVTMRDLCRRWLDDVAAHSVRGTTLSGYWMSLENHVIPRIGGVRADRLRLHDLRHTNITLDLAGGTSVHAVAKRVGHSDPAITLRVYSHVLDDEEAAAVERLVTLLSVDAG